MHWKTGKFSATLIAWAYWIVFDSTFTSDDDVPPSLPTFRELGSPAPEYTLAKSQGYIIPNNTASEADVLKQLVETLSLAKAIDNDVWNTLSQYELTFGMEAVGKLTLASDFWGWYLQEICAICMVAPGYWSFTKKSKKEKKGEAKSTFEVATKVAWLLCASAYPLFGALDVVSMLARYLRRSIHSKWLLYREHSQDWLVVTSAWPWERNTVVPRPYLSRKDYMEFFDENQLLLRKYAHGWIAEDDVLRKIFPNARKTKENVRITRAICHMAKHYHSHLLDFQKFTNTVMHKHHQYETDLQRFAETLKAGELNDEELVNMALKRSFKYPGGSHQEIERRMASEVAYLKEKASFI